VNGLLLLVALGHHALDDEDARVEESARAVGNAVGLDGGGGHTEEQSGLASREAPTHSLCGGGAVAL